MSVLVTGATGTVGSIVVSQLVTAGLDVRAYTRSPETANFPAGVTPVKGELLDVDALGTAMDGVEAVFILSPVVPDELNVTISALNLCREQNIKAIAYLSVFRVDETPDVPHFASKFAAERMIKAFNMPVTILRPNAFMQSPGFKDALLGPGIFPAPIGQKGVSFADVRDIAEVAVLEIQRRLAAKEALGPEVYELVSEEVLTGESAAKLWSDALNRPIRYIGDDLDQWIQGVRRFAPNWMAYDFKYMMKHFQENGAGATAADIERLSQRLGRKPRSYSDFVLETAKLWSGASN
jgi:uncharacterized protein YbjT (DUF2867 family)